MPRRARPVPLPWLRVDATLAVSAERQIAAALRQAIRNGTLARGFHLPSARQLALDLGVSRRAVTGAYARLAAERYIDNDGPPVVAGMASMRRGASSITMSSRARAMPGRAPQGLLAPGSVALDAFPWRTWWQCATDCDLREAIAMHVCAMRGIAAAPEEIVLTAGREDAIACAARLLADPGDLAFVETPGDPRARAIYEHCALRVQASALDAEGVMLDRTGENVRLIHVTPRHWPTGVVMSPGRCYLLLQWAKGAGAAIVEDDRHGDCALKSLDRDGCVVYVGSFDTVLFPDAGVAFLIVPPELAAAAGRLCTRPAPSPLAEFISSSALARHMATMRPLYEERRQALLDVVEEKLSGVVDQIADGAALDLVLSLAPDLDDEAIATAVWQLGAAPLPMRSCAFGDGEIAPALIVGYGAVTPRDARVAVERLARAVESTLAARRHA